jgi:hypothetical protein
MVLVVIFATVIEVTALDIILVAVAAPFIVALVVLL